MSEWGIGIGSKAKRAAQTMIDNGKVTSPVNQQIADPMSIWEKGLDLIVDGIRFTVKFLLDNNEIFIIICLVGMIIVISGREELGKKISSGGFLGFVIAKVVEELC